MYSEDFIRTALRLYNLREQNQYKIVQILNILNIARSTLYTWIKKYSDDPNLISENKLQRKTRTNKITRKCIDYIIDHVTSDPYMNIRKLRTSIKKIFSVKINQGYIYQLLKENNITYKKVQKKKYPYGTIKMNQEKQKLKNNIQSANSHIISIDETSFELGTRPDYGWSKRGKRCTVNVTNIRKKIFSHADYGYQ